jgi:hypothetical protein
MKNKRLLDILLCMYIVFFGMMGQSMKPIAPKPKKEKKANKQVWRCTTSSNLSKSI